MFFIIEDADIAGYADDNKTCIIADNTYGVIECLEEGLEILFKWFSDSLMKINGDKCHSLVIRNNTVKIKIGNFVITNSKSEKLSGIKFDLPMITFQNYVKKASRKTHALSRVASYMNISERRILVNAFFKSQFSYYRLV